MTTEAKARHEERQLWGIRIPSRRLATQPGECVGVLIPWLCDVCVLLLMMVICLPMKGTGSR
jgi:hypothetical protein